MSLIFGITEEHCVWYGMREQPLFTEGNRGLSSAGGLTSELVDDAV